MLKGMRAERQGIAPGELEKAHSQMWPSSPVAPETIAIAAYIQDGGARRTALREAPEVSA